MKISILFFGVAQELASARQMVMEMPDDTSVANLRHELAIRFNGLDDTLAYAVAVNEKISQMDRILNEGDVVAILPPVSGG